MSSVWVRTHFLPFTPHCQHFYRYFFTGSYDGAIRAFDYSQKLLHTSTPHSAPITSICLLPSSAPSPESHLVASASQDLTARLTRVSLPSSPSEQPKAHTVASLHLHTAPVSSVAANASGSHILTSSWDGLIGLWDTSIPEADEVPLDDVAGAERKKRRRVADDEDRPRRKAPTAVLKSHTARVSRAVFGPSAHDGNAYSCGLDSTVRTWDVEHGVCTSTIVRITSPVPSSLSSPPRSATDCVPRRPLQQNRSSISRSRTTATPRLSRRRTAQCASTTCALALGPP